MTDSHRLSAIHLAGASPAQLSPAVAQEILVARRDLLASNHFAPHGHPGAGPFHLYLAREDGRFQLQVTHADGRGLLRFTLSLAGLRRLIRDYFLICEQYYGALGQAGREQVETFDMARRSLHDEAAELLRELLAPFVATDLPTARRLFTLLCALQLRPQQLPPAPEGAKLLPHVLFVCDRNAVRSPLAEQLWRQRLGPDGAACHSASAGLEPALRADPLLVPTLQARGINFTVHRPLPLSQQVLGRYGWVVALSETAAAIVPAMLHPPQQFHYWPLPVPPAEGQPAMERQARLDEICQRLEERLDDFLPRWHLTRRP